MGGRESDPYVGVDLTSGCGGHGPAEMGRRAGQLPAGEARAVPHWVIGSVTLSRNQIGCTHCHGQELIVRQQERWHGADMVAPSTE